MMIDTEAWVLRAPTAGCERAKLRLESFQFSPPTTGEVLVRPLYGCWEGNMSHALRRSPIDLCVARGEAGIVLGNAGVVEVVDAGPESGLRHGDCCVVFCNGEPDAHGYPKLIYGYDAPSTIGILSKLTKLKASQLIKVPSDSSVSLAQWAAFPSVTSLRGQTGTLLRAVGASRWAMPRSENQQCWLGAAV